MPSVTDTHRLDTALEDVLGLLRRQLGLSLWAAHRREGDELRVVATCGEGVALRVGDQFPWSDTICARMIAGGPRAAPDLAAVPAYAATPLAQRLGLGAYVGVPVTVSGQVVGALCGLDRESHPPGLADQLPVVELCGRIVSALWQSKREARTDALTGLPNRRGWEETLIGEEERCRRFGHSAAVLAVDLDDLKQVNERDGHPAGDERLCLAAEAIGTAVREHDTVARWGGDEFTVLAVECDEHAADRLCRRVSASLRNAGAPASLGLALREPAGLDAAVASALAAIREQKRSARTREGSYVGTGPRA